MAITHVNGTVTRTFYNGKGAEVLEEFQAGGQDIKKRWACWFENAHGLSEGQQVEVSGLHSDTVDEWTDKENQTRHSVKRSLNKARINTGKAQAAPSAPVNVPQEEPWGNGAATAQTVDYGLPF